MRIAKTVLHTLGRPRRQIRRSIAVLEPFEKDPDVTASDVGREIRLRSDRFAESDELIGPEVIVLVLLRTVLQIFVRPLSFCILYPAQKLTRVGRLSRAPTPSRQSYWSAKQPPG
jgi:hypothetical protein